MNVPNARCAACPYPYGKRICKTKDGLYPDFCATVNHSNEIEIAKEEYQRTEATAKFARIASIQEGCGYALNENGKPYPIKPRIVETLEFCKKCGYTRVGLAFCGGLLEEAKVINRIFEAAGLTVVSAICKVGGVDKSFLGLTNEEKIMKGSPHESMCNPIAQACILNAEETEFNIVLGLCVGHDSLFIKSSNAMCTVLAVKDRVTGNNPLSPIYTCNSYYKALLD